MNPRTYLEGLQVPHFTAEELLFKGAAHQDNGLNTDPPGHLLGNIRQTAWIASLARSALQVPLRVVSAYRSEAYNAAIGGASQSFHKLFNALDLDPLRGATPRELFHLLYGWRAEGVFKGGLGLYPHFVHLDTRGENATWGT